MAFASPQVTAKYQRFGSMVSMAPEDMDAFRVPLATPGFGPPLELPPEPDDDEPPELPQAAARRVVSTAAAAASFTRRG
jgi:hypothetical protein